MSNDTFNVQRGIVGKGVGDDTYILSANLVEANASITISDVEGSNRIQLISGLSITASRLAANTLELTLSNGAVITVLDADKMTFVTGGNPLSGEPGLEKNYQNFGADILGVAIPGSGVVTGGSSEIKTDGSADVVPPTVPDTPDSTLLDLAQTHSNTNSGLGTLPAPGDTPSLESGQYWNQAVVTYSFNQTQPADYRSDEVPGLDTFVAFPEAAKASVYYAFSNIETFSGVTFQEVASDGDIRFNALSQQGDTDAFAFFPGLSPVNGDVFLNALYTTTDQYAQGGSPFFTAVHEIGHAMGLDHPFEGGDALPADQDNTTVSVMSYTEKNYLSLEFSFDGTTLTTQPVINRLGTDYALLDVAAIQAAYGANESYNAGSSVYEVMFGTTVQDLIWDSSGTDLLDASAATGASTIDLRPGTLSSVDVHTAQMQADAKVVEMGFTNNAVIDLVLEKYEQYEAAEELYTGADNLAIARSVWIENVITAAGNDVVQDNAVDNNIQTGAGNDVIHLTEGGFDHVDGGSGIDTVQLAVAAADVQVEQQFDGSYLAVGGSFAVSLVGVETLTFSDSSMSLV